MSDDVFKTEVNKKHDEMIAELSSINVENLKSEGLSISIGGKTFKFTDLEVINDENLADTIRAEYREKINKQQQSIREKINTKINQLLVMHQQKQRELDRKEEQLKKKYSESAMMPEINEMHLIKGLSVVRGTSNNELIWVYRAVYNPRFIIYYPNNRYDNENKTKKPIPKRLVNRMKRDMIILIKTKNESILSISTKEFTNGRSLNPFPHYHQQTHADCWGSWSYTKKWKTPDDIIRLAKEAESILETINHGSLAEQTPRGLPRIDTIIKSVENVDEVDDSIIISTNDNDNNESDDDIWSSL